MKKPRKAVARSIAARPPELLPPAGPQAHLMVVQSSWQGPLPSPQHLAQFDEIVPGAAARILDDWEAETNHRRKYENRVLNAEITERLGSRALAFIFAALALSIAASCAMNGQPIFGGIIGGTTIVGVVAAFLRQTQIPSTSGEDEK